MIAPSFILLFHFIFLTWFFDCDIKRDFMYGKYRWQLSVVDQLFSYCLLTNHIKPHGLSCRSNVAKRRKRSGGSLAGHEELGGLKTAERIRVLLLNGCSTGDRGKFLAANPTPCSLGSLDYFSCQKNVSWSLGLPLEATLVSCKASMPILSRNHLFVADQRKGQDTLSWQFSLLGAGWVTSFPGAEFQYTRRFLPAFKQVDCGGSAPYWLGSWPADSSDYDGPCPFRCWRKPVVSGTTPIGPCL